MTGRYLTLLKILGVQMFADLMSRQFQERRFEIDKLMGVACNAGRAELLAKLAAELAANISMKQS